MARTDPWVLRLYRDRQNADSEKLGNTSNFFFFFLVHVGIKGLGKGRADQSRTQSHCRKKYTHSLPLVLLRN